MDLKALIAKMDHIESKQLLNEGFPTVADAKARADKEKTTGKFDKKEIKPGVTQYTRKSSTFDDGGKDSDQKKAEKKKKNEGINFQSSIAQMLLKEFGLDERVTINPDGTTSGGIAPPPAAAGAEFKFTPEQEKFLGGANRQDPNIIARMPGAKPPVSYFKDPADQAIAKQLNFGQQNLNTLKTAVGAKPRDAQKFADPSAAAPAAAPTATGTQNQTPDAAAQADRIANRMDQEAGANIAGTPSPAAPAAGGDTGEVPGVTTQSGASPASAPSAAPAAGTTQWPADKAAIMAFQKANGLAVDGMIGKNTMAALQKAGATPPAGFKPVGNKAKPSAGQAAQPAAKPAAGNPEANQTAQVAARTGVAGNASAGGGRGGQGGPTAAQAAQAGNPAVVKLDAEIKRFSAKNDMTIAANQKYVAGLEAKKAAAGGQAAQPAAAPAAAPAKTFAQDTAARKAAAQPGALGSGTYQTQSVRNEDDAILERIRTALFR